MRHIHLARSRTGDGLTVSLELYQSPIIIYDDSADDEGDDGRGAATLGLSVTVSSASSRQIGGVTLVRKVLLKRRIPKSKNWGEWEEVQVAKMDVVGESWIRGRQRIECSMPLPRRLPESRQTHYDHVMHTIEAVVHDVAPSYPAPPPFAPAQSSTSDPARGAAARPRAHTQPSQTMPEGRSHRDLSAKKVFEIARCPTPQGDVPTLDWGQVLRLSDSGKATIRAYSDLFVLGSRVDFTLDFQSLTSDTTIHAISAKLVQETSTPIKTTLTDLSRTPSPVPSTQPSSAPANGRRRPPLLSRISASWARVKEKPPLPESSILDEYMLLTEGEDHIVSSSGFQLRQGSHLWRGEAGRVIDAQRTGSTSSLEYLEDSKASHAVLGGVDVTERTTSTMRLQRRVRLPSYVTGANASSSSLVPVLAKVAHRIEVDVIYSIIGQDQLGKPMRCNPGEGALRLARALVEVNMAPCSVTPASVHPPSYFSPCVGFPRAISPVRRLSIDTVRRSFDATHATQGPLVPHTRAFRASNGYIIGGKKVFYDESEVAEELGKHKKRQGECACFTMWEGGLSRALSGSC